MLSDFRRGASQCGEGDGGWAIFSRTPSWAYIDRYDTYEFRSTDFRRGQGPAIFTDLGTVGNGIRGRVDFRGEGCAAPEIRALRADADYAVKEGDLLHTDGAGAFRLASSTAEGDNERLLLQVGDESSDTALPPYCATRIQIEKPAPKERGLATFASKLAEVIRVRAGLSR